MARRVFDYLLLGLVPSAEDMALTQQGKSAPIVGKQRPASEYLLPGAPGAAANAASAPAVIAGAAPTADNVRVAQRAR
jgi:penicillin-binding protein 2